ncbi:LLM class flavin-dependent oxidoreductase [Blastococcus saxobsidens]|uniref:Luciferase family protein n=1 Tax=Blastococcus saxobsidens (strain DD2) TaxID=1146883 RepID=H6RPD2_BLASD|nr:LLM class flavin-dependent oxidoreductase [Blastococcus saxobsidens]CCG03991.1 Luciferase family protein [Blastococcus saxobsidens DD2]
MTPTLAALVLPDRHPVSSFLADVQEAERAGVRAVWTYDHLTWPLLADGPWYGAVPLLAAAAMCTETVRLGTQVASPNFRHPVPFAKELVTLDQLTGGRLEVGVGAGTEGPDALVLGEEPLSRAERAERFAEWLGLLDQLLREPVTTVQGPRYTAVDAHQLPGCVQQPRLPFTVAATGPRALRLAARYGQGWVTYGPYGPSVAPKEWFAAVADQSRRLTDALSAEGRAADAVRRSAQFGLEMHWPFESRERYADTLGRLTEAGIDEVSVHWPRPDGRGVPAAALSTVVDAHGSAGRRPERGGGDQRQPLGRVLR